jgi:iron complex outermembrane receptor protein
MMPPPARQTAASLRALVAALLLPLAVGADDVDLATLSLEELMDVEVSLVSRREEPLFATAAAVTVITGEDIRRSGATSLPEVLRLIPGVQASRLDANKWAVSARGFADRVSQKLLVLVDGRSIYSPIFGGVFWESYDVVLEDVERVELIRGPGATLWGANAMNGILNVVTRNSSDTQGRLVALAGGTQERGTLSVRQGGRLSGNATWRLFARAFDRDEQPDVDGNAGHDGQRLARAGLRLDWSRGDDEVMLDGDWFAGEAGQVFRYPALEPPLLRTQPSTTDLDGGHLLMRWHRRPSQRHDWRLQVYHDRSLREDFSGETDRSTWDADFQQSWRWTAGHESTWGAGYRRARLEFIGNPQKMTMAMPLATTDLYSAFAQHRLDVGPLNLSAGTKVERNDFTGVEWQPGLRALWRLSQRRALWAAATRAVRTPALADDQIEIIFRSFPAELTIPGVPLAASTMRTHIVGDGTFESEVLNSLEAGYRQRLRDDLLVDLAAYRNRYTELRGGIHRPALPFLVQEPQPHYVDRIVIANAMDGTMWGGEIALEWRLPRERGRVRAWYATSHLDLTVDPGAELDSAALEGGTPEHQASLWLSLDPASRWHLDGILRYASSITDRPEGLPVPTYDAYLPQRDIDGFFELDLRLAWRLRPGLEIAAVGRNLLHARHAESADLFLDTQPTETQRSLYLSLTWRD